MSIFHIFGQFFFIAFMYALIIFCDSVLLYFLMFKTIENISEQHFFLFQDGKMLVWDAFTTNKVRILKKYLDNIYHILV